MNKDELLSYMQSVIDMKYAGSQAAFALDNDLSAAYVNDILKGRREPGKKVLDVLAVEKFVGYKLK